MWTGSDNGLIPTPESVGWLTTIRDVWPKTIRFRGLEATKRGIGNDGSHASTLEACHFTFGGMVARIWEMRAVGGVSQMRTGGAQHTGDADEQMIVATSAQLT